MFNILYFFVSFGAFSSCVFSSLTNNLINPLTLLSFSLEWESCPASLYYILQVAPEGGLPQRCPPAELPVAKT